jgi:hypothetical protein
MAEEVEAKIKAIVFGTDIPEAASKEVVNKKEVASKN